MYPFENWTYSAQRISAKQLCSNDAPTLLKIYSDKEAMKYRGSKALCTLNDAKDMVKYAYVEGDYKTKLRLAIWLKNDPQLIGTLLIKQYAEQKALFEIGFSFAKDHWGNGYATETLSMAEQSIFANAPTATIQAWCRKENVASIKVFQKAQYKLISQSQYPNCLLFQKSKHK